MLQQVFKIKMNIVMNKQNKRKLIYKLAQVNKTSPENLQMTLETKSSTMQIT